MLKGSAAVLTHRVGEKRTDSSAQSHQLAAVAVWGPARAHAPFRKENPHTGTKSQGLVSKAGWSHLCLPCHLKRGFLRSQSTGRIHGQ